MQYIATVCINKYTLPDVKHCRTGVSPVQARCPGHVSLYDKPALFIGSHLPHSSYHSGFDHIIVPLPEMPYPQQHLNVWQKIKQHCAVTLSVPEEEIHLHKDEGGAPWITISSAERVPLSISHHGRFGAFAFSPQSTV